ncbi:hypothetical protein GCM10025785_25600 [Corynebacterium canis]
MGPVFLGKCDRDESASGRFDAAENQADLTRQNFIGAAELEANHICGTAQRRDAKCVIFTCLVSANSLTLRRSPRRLAERLKLARHSDRPTGQRVDGAERNLRA